VERIEDAVHNYTRFFIIGHQIARPTGKDKTSVVISVKDRPGALYQLLLPFADAGVNLTRIESRPSRKKAWEYVFFVDMLGHSEEEPVKSTLQRVADNAMQLKVLGSFPIGDEE
jgi:chorismate mutase/prephenate dehydratase